VESSAPPPDRQAQHALTLFNLTSLTRRATELAGAASTPADLWSQVEQVVQSVYWPSGLSGAISGLADLAAAALLEHDRHPAAADVDLAGWRVCREEHGPWPEQFLAPAGPVAVNDRQTWALLAAALEGKHACDVIPLSTAPNRLAQLAAGAIVRVALADGEQPRRQ